MSERRWLILAVDGRHTWLGRATDPSDEEVTRAATALTAQSLSGWLAVSNGDYWSIEERMTLLMVRSLAGASEDGWESAVQRFEERRVEAAR